MASNSKYGPLVTAVDQGTSSTRVLIFAANSGELLTYHQVETKQIFPNEGWVEQDPMEILDSVMECVDKAVENLKALNIDPADVKAVGITNQRESTIVWDRVSGKPLHNAIIWLDARTAETVKRLVENAPGRNKDFLRPRCGLPISTYFSALKVRWLLDHIAEVRKAVTEDRLMFGTVDSWIVWNLTGGANGGIHVTDVTNASRTMLMNINHLEWDKTLCQFFGIPMSILPKIRSSSEIYGHMKVSSLQGVPISGILGDQQAALVGQFCLKQGQAKNTYGTGCFLLYNTGPEIVESKSGLLTTVAYQMGKDKPAYYALEGSVAIAGAGTRWLRDNLGIIKDQSEVESLASSVETTHGCYFVPAFSGLFCPYWQTEARGVICGLTQYTNKAHIARATLEAVCFQTRELLEAMKKDNDITLDVLNVDGGMTSNDLLMQLQADITGVAVVRPSMPETTALGAAMVAGAAAGVDVWKFNAEDVSKVTSDTFTPSITENERNLRFQKWRKAVDRSMNWVDETDNQVCHESFYASIPGGTFVFTSLALMLIADLIKNR